MAMADEAVCRRKTTQQSPVYLFCIQVLICRRDFQGVFDENKEMATSSLQAPPQLRTGCDDDEHSLQQHSPQSHIIYNQPHATTGIYRELDKLKGFRVADFTIPYAATFVFSSPHSNSPSYTPPLSKLDRDLALSDTPYARRVDRDAPTRGMHQGARTEEAM